MSEPAPIVTVGIPTFNRELLIGRAVNLILSQDYPNIEIVISDNCSTDSTPSLCQGYADRDPRIRYIRQPRNVGATGNFETVLTLASGEFFMWLGDDDYLDCNYISVTLKQLLLDPAVALASGLARYYHGDTLVDTGREFSVESDVWWRRIAKYYWKVSDNGVFYGLMRTATIRQVRLKKRGRRRLAGDRERRSQRKARDACRNGCTPRTRRCFTDTCRERKDARGLAHPARSISVNRRARLRRHCGRRSGLFTVRSGAAAIGRISCIPGAAVAGVHNLARRVAGCRTQRHAPHASCIRRLCPAVHGCSSPSIPPGCRLVDVSLP